MSCRSSLLIDGVFAAQGDHIMYTPGTGFPLRTGQKRHKKTPDLTGQARTPIQANQWSCVP
jgi:hypothetical protein